ncbi:MAG: hypothetical protein IPM47_16820 [Sphingobacteriales bacterium]|nr:MAG: hypothetical protein IPM47_16820 [Sphingobacteriales bacterium]
MKSIIATTLFLSLGLLSCETELAKNERLAREEKQRIELEQQKAEEEKAAALKLERERIEWEKQEKATALRLEQERIEREKEEEAERVEREAELERERQEKAIYDKYINNSLSTGSTPYSYCYGRNNSCSNWGCSEISVKTPSNSDVLVTIKKDEEVVRHAYIKSSSSYTFELHNGTYQPFFYYGKGWNPEKFMKQAACGTLKGGFITDEHFGKDSPQSLSNDILQYELILQQNGNFSTRPSNSEEAL